MNDLKISHLILLAWVILVGCADLSPTDPDQVVAQWSASSSSEWSSSSEELSSSSSEESCSSVELSSSSTEVISSSVELASSSLIVVSSSSVVLSSSSILVSSSSVVISSSSILVSSSSVVLPSSSSILVSSSSVVISSSSIELSSSSVELSSSSSLSAWCNTAGNCDTFSDSRDNTTYKWTKIGGQVWMAENLNFGTHVHGTTNQANATSDIAEKYCYGNDEFQCNTHGGLYQWHTVMALPSTCNTSVKGTAPCIVNIPHRGICPEGWHVPTQAEWIALNDWVDLNNDGNADDEGTSLKSTHLWIIGGTAIQGTDAYGWNGLPSGIRYEDKVLRYLNEYSFWWSATPDNASMSYRGLLDGNTQSLSVGFHGNTNGFSLRCVKD